MLANRHRNQSLNLCREYLRVSLPPLAGFLPLPWFRVWIFVAGAKAPDYSAISQQASEMTLLPGLPHVLVDTAALGIDVAFLAFASGVWLESRRRLAVGALAWMFFGIAMASNGIWAMGARNTDSMRLALSTWSPLLCRSGNAQVA